MVMRSISSDPAAVLTAQFLSDSDGGYTFPLWTRVTGKCVLEIKPAPWSSYLEKKVRCMHIVWSQKDLLAENCWSWKMTCWNLSSLQQSAQVPGFALFMQRCQNSLPSGSVAPEAITLIGRRSGATVRRVPLYALLFLFYHCFWQNMYHALV